MCRMRQHQREEEQRKEEEMMEAAEIRRLAAEWAEEERLKAEMLKEKAMKQADDNKRQIEDIGLVKHIDRMQEEVVDFLNIREF